VQTFAETLACLVIVNLVRPGTSMPFGMWPCVSDLRSGAFSGGSGEFAVINAATAQMCNFYGLVSSVATGMTDSKTMDAQAGYEKALTTLAAVLAGGNDVCAYPGSVGSLIGFSFEGMVIDNDMMGSVLRVLRGIEVNDDTLSYKAIEDAVFGPGHYLGHEQTLRLMKTEYLYPEVGDRRNPTEWMQEGRQTVYELAHERLGKLLGNHYPEYIEPGRDQEIRERFPIKLTREQMSPKSGRW
jgi:trimethylamine--corrinoid protein Co-methyltransferase